MIVVVSGMVVGLGNVPALDAIVGPGNVVGVVVPEYSAPRLGLGTPDEQAARSAIAAKGTRRTSLFSRRPPPCLEGVLV